MHYALDVVQTTSRQLSTVLLYPMWSRCPVQYSARSRAAFVRFFVKSQTRGLTLSSTPINQCHHYRLTRSLNCTVHCRWFCQKPCRLVGIKCH